MTLLYKILNEECFMPFCFTNINQFLMKKTNEPLENMTADFSVAASS